MLIELSIRNFALVDDLTVALLPGMTVVTGETGAGKSIIIDALGAALGERTGTDVIRSGADTASVDAVFEIGDCPKAAAALQEAGLADGDDGIVVLSRQIGAGRSACRVNGRPVTAAVLQSISKHLVDVHGQHEHQTLIHEENHLEFLDNFGGASHLTLRRAYEQAYHEFREATGKLRNLRERSRERGQRLEMLRYQVEEIRAAEVRAEEEDELQAERQRLNSVEKLRELADEALSLLSGGEETVGATGAVQQAAGNLSKLAEIDSSLGAAAEELTGAAAVVSEAEHSLYHYLGSLESDPQRLEEIEGRLDALSRLKRKYGDTLADVISYLQSAEEELAAIEDFEAEEARLQGIVQQTREAAVRQAEALTKARRALGKKLGKAMTEHVGPLGMPAARFEVELRPVGGQAEGDAPAGLGPRGGDECRFLFCANPGENMRPLVKVASGGELSRIMLAFKSLCSRGSEIPSIVFDEVDAGIGGQTAHKVGEKLRELAGQAQVLCVTHLPQIAGLANNHLHVEKIVSDGRTRVQVRALAETERAEELARMLGADDDDTTARKHAERVLKRGTQR
ncbi:MAG: DNA repair protein RecN [Armatimonadia bacterium]